MPEGPEVRKLGRKYLGLTGQKHGEIQDKAEGLLSEKPARDEAGKVKGPLPKPVKKRRQRVLSEKQEKLVTAFLSSSKSTLRSMSRESGYSSEAAVCRALKLPRVQERIRALMDCHPELRDGSLLEKLAEKMSAKKTEFFSWRGKVLEQREVEAHDIQIRALELAGKWKGLADDRVVISGDVEAPLSIQAAVAALSLLSSAPPPEASAPAGTIPSGAASDPAKVPELPQAADLQAPTPVAAPSQPEADAPGT